MSARIGLEKGNATAKATLIKEWKRKIPSSPAPHLIAALDAQTAGESKAAIGHYKKVIELQPNQAVALNNLAWLLFENNNPSALELAAKAAKLAPNSPEVLDTYGWIEMHQGSKIIGLKTLEKAAELAPENKVIQDHLKAAKNI
jgi:Tfp pilus assembly protein PilF